MFEVPETRYTKSGDVNIAYQVVGHGQEVGFLLYALVPGRADDPAFRKAHGRWERLSASPGAAVAIAQMILEIDVRHVLSTIRVPTLVVHRTADEAHARGSRFMGARIPGAKVVELPGTEYFPYLGDQDAILDEIEEFLTSTTCDTAAPCWRRRPGRRLPN